MSYGKSLNFNVCFDGFEKEISSLPGEYAPPQGCLLLALNDGNVVGVIALRPLADDGAAEIKRLFVDPAARGLGVGRQLTERALAEARSLAYRTIRLETLASMTAANEIYDDLGFKVVPAFDTAPSLDVICKELAL